MLAEFSAAVGLRPSPGNAGDEPGNHKPSRCVQALQVGNGARGQTWPQGNGIGCVRRDGGHTQEKQHREGHKAAASRDSIQNSGNRSGEK